MRKHHLAPCVALMLAALTLSGCAAVSKIFHPSPIDPGEDAFLVNAERTLKSSFVIADKLVSIDNANRELLKAQAPAVHAGAEKIRQEAPDAFRKAWAALDAYRLVARTPEGVPEGDAVEKELQAVEQLAARAREILAQLNAQGLNLKPPAKSGGLPSAWRATPSRFAFA